MSDLISREALKEDFKSRLADCNGWIENAKDNETKIRASAVKAFICEVIMTIDNAPTIELGEDGVDLEKYSDRLYKIAYEKGKNDRPTGEWVVSGYIDTFRGYVAKCPFCKEDTVGGGNFCKHCGADMRGKEKLVNNSQELVKDLVKERNEENE